MTNTDPRRARRATTAPARPVATGRVTGDTSQATTAIAAAIAATEAATIVSTPDPAPAAHCAPAHVDTSASCDFGGGF